MNNIEDLIRDALNHQATQAPPASSVHTRQATRQRRWLVPTAIAATMAAAAVVLYSVNHAPAGGVTVGTSEAPVDWSPTWMLPGFTEHNRSTAVDGSYAFTSWFAGPVDARDSQWVRLNTYPRTKEPCDDSMDGAERVTVAGNPGVWFASSPSLSLCWSTPTGQFSLSSYNVLAGRSEFIRIAESLRSAPRNPLHVPLTATFPVSDHPGVPLLAGIKGDTPDAPTMYLTSTDTPDGIYSVGICTTKPADPLGTPVPTRNTTGWWTRDEHNFEKLTVPVDTRWLVVTYLPTGGHRDPHTEALAQLANTVVAGPTPATPWIGGRP
ncbi:hypothetical protein [Actinokineospora inagensis]|uniref:hypothetical protein n=1 Tax=Actinokineospora inagensis TaxID=103730 RepID=UPI000422C485|nr:hypothetical protein [Actinokineospora inagensis]